MTILSNLETIAPESEALVAKLRLHEDAPELRAKAGDTLYVRRDAERLYVGVGHHFDALAQ